MSGGRVLQRVLPPANSGQTAPAARALGDDALVMIRATRSAPEREGLVVGGLWLIAIGSVFVVQQLTAWPWSEAWPLFLIMAGIATALTAVVTRDYHPMGLWRAWWPLAFTVIGVVLLLSTTGSIDITPAQLLVWWPVAVIALGLWFLLGAVFAGSAGSSPQQLALPLGGLAAAEVRLRFAGGELRIGEASPGMLVSGTFTGGVRVRDRSRRGRVELRPYAESMPFWGGAPLHWDVGISSQIPVDLRLEAGASRSDIDLSALHVRQLELHTGASETTVRLPTSGSTSFRAEAGVASLTIAVPPGVAARIHSRMTIGSTNVDESRFPRALDGWQSADYETAANRVDIDLHGGLGSIRVN